MMTRIYTWSYTLKIASATNVTQPLASKKKTTLLYVYVSIFFLNDTNMYPNISKCIHKQPSNYTWYCTLIKYIQKKWHRYLPKKIQ